MRYIGLSLLFVVSAATSAQSGPAYLDLAKSLRAFKRVSLQPGETRHVEFTLPVEQLAFYDVARHRMRVEPGVFDIQVGSSSDDIRLRQTVTVAEPKR